MANPDSTGPAISEVRPVTDTGLARQDDEKTAISAASSIAPGQDAMPSSWWSSTRRRFGFPSASSSGSPYSEPKGLKAKLWKFFKFLGPGAIVSVAYVDPDNYQSAISSGASFQYKLLFMVLVSNIVAIFLQVRPGQEVDVVSGQPLTVQI